MVIVKNSPKGYVVEIDSYSEALKARVQGLRDGLKVLVSAEFAARVGIPPDGEGWSSRYPGSGVITYADDLAEAIESELADPIHGGVQILRRGTVCR